MLKNKKLIRIDCAITRSLRKFLKSDPQPLHQKIAKNRGKMKKNDEGMKENLIEAFWDDHDTYIRDNSEIDAHV